MIKAAWIGLGVMGHPMAGYLSKFPEIEVTVYNRTTSKAENWLETYDGKIAQTPQQAAIDADYVFSCIGNDDDLREITSGPNGTFKTMKPGAIMIDHSTTSATVAREVSAAALAQNLHFLDSPVTGGQKGAVNGTLSIMVGGDRQACEKATPLIETYAKAVRHMGPSGSGQQTKMVNQIAIAGLVQALSEAINFAKKSNLNIDDVLAVISKGAAQSWQMENSGKTMAEGFFDFGFAVDLMRKDLNICLDEAKTNGAPLPITTQIEKYFEDLQQHEHGRSDITSLITRLNS